MDWVKTEEPGIYRHETIEGKWRVRTTAKNPQGELKEVQRTLSNSTFTEARKLRDELKVEIQTPDDIVESKSISYFAARWVRQMIDAGRWGKATRSTNEGILKDHICPRIGHLPVDELGREDIREWIEWAEGVRYDRSRLEDEQDLVRYSHSSLRRWWVVFKQLVKALYLEGHCGRRLVAWCREIPGPRADDIPKRREDATLTFEELRKLVAKAETSTPTRYAEIVTLAYTGIRGGELYGLEWKDVRPEEGYIRVARASTPQGMGPTKNGETRRVPMVPAVREALQEHRLRLIREQNLGLEQDIVFPSDVGTRRISSALHKPLRKVADECEIDVKMGPQVLRSTFVTLMKARGVPRPTVKAIVGHNDDQTNEDYTRPRVEGLTTEVVRAFGEAVG
jgi:integrase